MLGYPKRRGDWPGKGGQLEESVLHEQTPASERALQEAETELSATWQQPSQAVPFQHIPHPELLNSP